MLIADIIILTVFSGVYVIAMVLLFKRKDF